MTYTAPKLTKVGSFEEVTKGTSGPGGLDANFPVNTPRADLTFFS